MIESNNLPLVPLLCGGNLEPGRSDCRGDVFNPSTGEVIAQVPYCTPDEVDALVQVASGAAAGWAATPVIERARLMFRYRELLEREFEDLARLVTREHGKTIAESRAEVRRGIEVVEFASGIPSLLMGRSLPAVAREVDASVDRHPVGVCVGITPYNFPAMVPLWMFPIAVVCGNPFILKPSEKTPLSAVRLGELLIEAGCPDGVFNILHGDRDCVDHLLRHPDVGAVSFVGSTSVARTIYETGTRTGKRVQAAGGAKNHLIIMPDADPQAAVEALASAAYGCGGQRCMAVSVAVTVGGIGDELVERLCTHASGLRVGPTDDTDDVDVGPLIRAEHRDRVAGYLDVARDEGAELALDGRRDYDSAGFLLGPSVVDRVRPDMRIARDEVFGPLLSVIRVADLDEALALGRDCEYGNGASIFTRDGYAARQFMRHFNAGMIGVNVAVPAPMAWFPFTGWNSSFFGDLHVQGTEGIQFYTRQKVTLSRWFPGSGSGSADDPIWSSSRPGPT